MSRFTIAALAGIFLCASAEGATYTPVADWARLGDGRETIGPMHGDIAVSSADEVYVSVETEGMGLQIFSPDGKYLRSLPNVPADLHGFVIRQTPAGEFIFGVSLRGQKFYQFTLDGKTVLEVSRDAIPKKYWVENRYSSELGVLLTGMDVAPNGDLYVSDGYSSDYIHRFDSNGNYIETFGGKDAPYNFNTLHKLTMDTRFDPVRIIATDRANNRVVHLGLDGRFLGVVNDQMRLPAAVVIDGDNVIVGELNGRVSILDKSGRIVQEIGTNTEDGVGSNQMPPERWRTGYVVSPHGVAIDADGNIYVAEFSTFGRVHKFIRH